MKHTVYFENASKQMREIGSVDTYKEALSVINTFLKERDYKAYYIRINEIRATPLLLERQSDQILRKDKQEHKQEQEYQYTKDSKERRYPMLQIDVGSWSEFFYIENMTLKDVHKENEEKYIRGHIGYRN